ncbi:PP2C family protein-serine/threonine phosphatase [Actinomadura luteofluorescens]|uniref:Serine phosphatase RsbU (Regulator of sigma subunit) n=2 Tax=Actinomadura luteofluorescens TaxID=46163 RepID=A0A7Y9EL12_9ACTN|nr:serine phosphatase RsbU (regulator of sigma subunit) [Actinomadura luteofluorescens]
MGQEMGISEDPDAAAGRGGLTWRVVAGWLVGITAALAVTGVALGRETGLAPFLIFLPTLIAGRGTVRQTAVASVWTILVIIGSLIRSPLPSAAATASVITFAVALNGLSVIQAVRRIRQEKEISRLRSAAAALQRQILRPFPLVTGELLVHGLYEPVEEDSMVGGDVYEAMPTPYGSRVLIADVQGKGLPAISAAFAVLSSFREAALVAPTLTALVNALENSVLRHNSFVAQTGEEQRFVTALVLGITQTTAQAINCGHIPPYILTDQQTGRVSLGEAALPLGLASLSPDPRTVTAFDFPTDSTLLLCTDGVTETRNPAGTFYPLEARLPTWKDLPPNEIAPTVNHDLEQYSKGKLTDDRALLILHRKPIPNDE